MYASPTGHSPVAFALSGGGARGACQVGMVRALLEAGIVPQRLTGTSVGAVTAAYLAVHPFDVAGVEALWRALRRQDIFPGTSLHVLANLVRRGHLHVAGALERYLRHHFGRMRIEDFKIPCSVVTVDLESGSPYVIESGEIVPALMASTAIPGVFPPVHFDGRTLVDGGVLEHMPLTPFMMHSVGTAYLLDCSDVSDATGTGAAVIDRTGRIAARANADAAANELERRGVRVELLRPSLPDIGDARSFHRTSDLIGVGYDYARLHLSVNPAVPAAVAE